MDQHQPHRRHHHNEDSLIIRLCQSIICKIPCGIVCSIVFGDCYLAFGFSRLLLEKRIGFILTWILLILFGICIILLLTSYFRCMLTSCAVKDNPPPLNVDLSKYQQCDRCSNIKPPRTHHCSLCNTCILKMDHHCPWVGNCVGLQNYKFFLIFLFWVCIAAGFYGLITGIAMITGFDDFGNAISVWCVLSMFITISFCLSVGGFFFFHVHLLRENKTTIENIKYGRHGKSPYKVDSNKDTFGDIFGNNPWTWFLPIVSLKETGYELFENSVDAGLLQNCDDSGSSTTIEMDENENENDNHNENNKQPTRK